MAVKFSNNFSTVLVSSISSSATVIELQSVSGLPTLAAGDHTYLTFDTDTNSPTIEIVKVTAINTTTNEVTVVRGQDNTSASAFAAGTAVELRMCAILLSEFLQEDGDGSNLTDVRAETVEVNVKNVSGGSLAKGTPVHQTGTSGAATFEVVAADASNASVMPAHFVLLETLADEAEGRGLLMGRISGVDTSSFSEGDTIYVAVGGGYTNVAPTGEGNLIQNLGTVTKVHASNGGGEVMGAGRSNATPNLNEGNIFLGNASNQAATASLSTSVSNLSHYNNANWDTAYGWGDHASAGYQAASTALTTSTTFGGDVSGTYNAIVVADDSHNHIISNVDGLQTALDGKVDLAGDTMTGTLNGTNFTASGDLTVSGDAELALIFLEDQNGTVSSRWGIYAWDDELQFTKRNLSTNAYAGAVLTLDYSTSQATFSGTISSGAITSTGTSTFAGIRVNNSNTALSQGGGNAVRITTNSGYVDVGPMNTSYSHFQTDRSNFYFGQPVHFGGQIYNYVGGGTSDPYWRAGNDGSGSGLDADLLDGQHASAFEPVNATILHQGSDIGNQDWNTFIDGTEASWNTVLNHSGSNRPSSAYTYGTALSFSKSGQAKLQIYAPETSSAGGTSAGMWYRTGWNTGYRDWQRIWDSGNDGSGSGLDADLLDGLQASQFLRSDAANNNYSHIINLRAGGNHLGNHEFAANTNQTAYSNSSIELREANYGGNATYSAPRISFHWGGVAASSISMNTSGDILIQNNPGTGYENLWAANIYDNSSRVWSAGNDGSGSGLDADLLDGIQSSSFLRSDTGDSWSGDIETTGTNRIRFGNAYQIDGNDGTIAAARFGTGLNIVGTQTTTGQGRVIRLWGSLITDQGHTYWHSGNDGSGSGLDADLLDGVHASSFLRSDANDTASGQYTFTKTDDHAIRVGTIRGTAVGDQSGEFIQLYERVHIGSPSGWGNGATTGAPSYGLSVYGGANLATHTGTVTIAGNTAWHAGNDGAGSGLDADLLDGIDSSQFLRSDAGDTATGSIVFNGASQYFRKSQTSGNYTTAALFTESYDSTSTGIAFHISGIVGKYLEMNTGGTLLWNSAPIWHSANDGSGSGLDADLLDGQHASYYEMPKSPQSTNVSANSFSAPAGQYASVQFFNLYTPSGSGNQAAYQVPEDGGSHYHIQQFNGYSNSYNNWKYQIAHSFYTGRMYHRNQYDTTWQGWATVWDSDSDGSGSGLDADLLDGLHASSFMRAAGTISGDAGCDATTGIGVYQVSMSGYTDLLLQAGGVGGSTPSMQIRANYQDSFWIRASRDSETQWDGVGSRDNLIWTSRNDGAGSGLDADLLDGLNSSSFLRVLGDNFSIADWNSLTSYGSWRTAPDGADANGPPVNQYGNLLVFGHSNGVTQLQAGHDGQLAWRTKWNASDWTGWSKAWTANNDGSGSGLDADLLDGIQASQFPRKDVYDSHDAGLQVFRNLGTATGSWQDGSHTMSLENSDAGYLTINFHRGGYTSHNLLYTGSWFRFDQTLYVTGDVIASANVTAYSDIRLKENIKVIPDALEKVQKIRGVTFTRNDQEDKEKLHTGVIAQEVETVLPEAVATNDDGIKHVAYGNMVGLLIEAIKELKAEVDDLKAQLEARQ